MMDPHEIKSIRRLGVEVRVEPAIEHMLRVARVFDGGHKGVTAEVALNAWPAE